MSFDAARPRYKLPFADAEYDLVGTMELIETVEYTLGRGISQVAVEIPDVLPTSELAKLLSAVVTVNGQKLTPTQAKSLIWEKIGVTGDGNTLLRMHLYSFLAICLAPPEQREKKAKEVGELLGKLPKASLGKSTSNSASES